MQNQFISLSISTHHRKVYCYIGNNISIASPMLSQLFILQLYLYKCIVALGLGCYCAAASVSICAGPLLKAEMRVSTGILSLPR